MRTPSPAIRLTRKAALMMIQLRMPRWRTSPLLVPSWVSSICCYSTLTLTLIDVDEHSPDEDEERARLALRRTPRGTPPNEVEPPSDKGPDKGKGKKRQIEESDDDGDESTTENSDKGIAILLSQIGMYTKYATIQMTHRHTRRQRSHHPRSRSLMKPRAPPKRGRGRSDTWRRVVAMTTTGVPLKVWRSL